MTTVSAASSAPAQRDAVEHAVAGRQQRGRRGRSSRRGISTCVSGSPKRALYSMSCGPSAVSIRPGIENARVGRAPRAHAGERRLDDLAHDPRLQLGRQDGGGRIGAHAARVRALVAVEDALVVLGGAERDRRSCRRTGRRSSPPRPPGTPRSPPRRPPAPNPPPIIMSTASSASSKVLGDDHALAGREPVRLHHDAARRSGGYRPWPPPRR